MGIFAKHNFKLAIRFENEDARVVPGRPIRGEVEVTVKSKTTITAIRVKLVGVEEVTCNTWGIPNTAAWEQKKAPTVENRQSKLFEQCITLFGFAANSGRRGGAELSAGTYLYPFDFTLPGNTPPSLYMSTLPTNPTAAATGRKMDSAVVSICYTATVSAVIPYGFDAHATEPFTVNSVIPSRLVEKSDASPLSLTRSRTLLTPDWAGWRACLFSCCGTCTNCVESIAGPFPRVSLDMTVWGGAAAVDKSAAMMRAREEAYEEGTHVAERVFSPVSVSDVVLEESRPAEPTVGGIPLEPMEPASTTEEGNANNQLSGGMALPQGPFSHQPQHEQQALQAPRTPERALTRPAPTTQLYQSVSAIPPHLASPQPCLLELRVTNDTVSTTVNIVHIVLTQVQVVTLGNVTVTRTLPVFQCTASMSALRSSARPPLPRAPLRPGQTSERAVIEVPLPALLITCQDEHNAICAAQGDARAQLFLPTISTAHLNVFMMLTVDTPGVVFEDGQHESCLLGSSNAIKMASFEDPSNAATGVYNKEIVMPELAFGAEEL